MYRYLPIQTLYARLQCCSQYLGKSKVKRFSESVESIVIQQVGNYSNSNVFLIYFVCGLASQMLYEQLWNTCCRRRRRFVPKMHTRKNILRYLLNPTYFYRKLLLAGHSWSLNFLQTFNQAPFRKLQSQSNIIPQEL